MTRLGACASRCQVRIALGFDQLEDRRVLSSLPSPSTGLAWVTSAAGPVLAAQSTADVSLIASDAVAHASGIVESASANVAVEINPALASANALAFAPNPAALVVPVPVAVPSNPASLAAATGGMVVTATQASGFALDGAPLAAPLIVPPPLRLSSFMTGITVSTGGAAQARFALGPPGDGEFVLVMNPAEAGIETISISGTTAIAAGELTTAAPTLTVASAPPGAFLLAPLVNAGVAGSGRLSSNGLLNPSTTTNTSIAAIALGTGNGIPSPCAVIRSAASLASLSAMDRAWAVGLRAIGQPRAYRDLGEPADTDLAETSDLDPLRSSRLDTEIVPAGAALPAPQRFDLITSFVPFDEAVVGQTIDGFLRKFDGLGGGLSGLDGSKVVIAELLAAAAAIAAWKAAPRFLKRNRAAAPASGDAVSSFEQISGLPGVRSPEEP